MAKEPRYNVKPLQAALKAKFWRYVDVGMRLKPPLSESSVHRTMTGKRSNPETVRRIAELLDVPFEALQPKRRRTA